MKTDVKESIIVQRAQDLCQAIVDESDFSSIKSKLDAFLGDEALKFRFQQLNDMGNLLHMKQNNGMDLKEEEITQFESLREEVMGNPVAQGFIDAQQELQRLHSVVGRLLDKTFELGRRPDFDDLHDGSCCGGGCHG